MMSHTACLSALCTCQKLQLAAWQLLGRLHTPPQHSFVARITGTCALNFALLVHRRSGS